MNIESHHQFQNRITLVAKRRKKNYFSWEEVKYENKNTEWYTNKFLRIVLNNVITYQFLRYINMENCMIFALTKEIGNLPFLEELDLRNNYLGYYNHKWFWLEQIPIRNNLLYLYLPRNLLTVLPIQIMMLRKLKKLCISHNRLTYLPQAIGFLRNLINLDVSNNKLAYLPSSIFKNNLYLNIMDNPLNHPREIVMPLELQSLFEFSARIVIKQWTQSDFAGELPIPIMITRYLFDMKYCIRCGNPCLEYYVKSFGLYDTITRIFILFGPYPIKRNPIGRICFYPCFLKKFILVWGGRIN